MRAAIVGAIAAAALALTGCAAEPPPTPAPSPTATESTPTPTSTPSADPLASVVVLMARPTALELQDEAGEVIVALDYRGDFATAKAELEAVLGPAEESEEARGTSHFPPSTMHRWGGFELWEQRYVDQWDELAGSERTLTMPSFLVRFTRPDAAAGVRLETTTGVDAGAPWSELEAVPGLQTNPSGCSGPYTDFLDESKVNADGEAYVSRTSVDYVASAEGSIVEAVRAPIGVAAGCA